MRRRVASVVVMASAVVLGFAAPAFADGSGTCTISGGTVRMNVRETPGEGSVKYVSVASPVQLNVGTDQSRADTYFESDGTWAQGKWLYSSPVDGDGYWNYRADFNWEAASSLSIIERVRFGIEQYGSTSSCHTNVYI